MNLRPLSMADILDDMIDIFVKRLFFFLLISMIIQLPSFAILFSFIQLLTRALHMEGSFTRIIPDLVLFIPLLMAFWLIFVFTKSLFTRVVSGEIEHKKMTFRELVSEGVARFNPVAGFALLSFIMYTSVSLLIFFMLAYASTSNTIMEKAVPALMLIILLCFMISFYFMIETSLTIPAIILEGCSLFKALRKSRELTHPSAVRHSIILTIVHLVIFVPALLMSVVSWWIVPFYLTVMLPAVSIAETIIFYDRMIRHGAYDLFVKGKELMKNYETPGSAL
jgi:hypothetical protein